MKDADDRILSDLTLEKFLLGELEGAEVERVLRILETSPEYRERLEQLRHSSQEILKKYPAPVISARIRSRLEESSGRGLGAVQWFRLLAPVPLVVLAFVALVPVLRQSASVRPGVTDLSQEDRTKGIGTALQVYRKRGDSLEKLAHGEQVRSGDLVQLSYVVNTRCYGVIVSIDGTGQITPHLPEKPGTAPSLEPGREIALPSAFEFDRSPGFEAFILVTSAEPFKSDEIGTLVRTGRLDGKTGQYVINLPRNFQQYTVTLRKAQ